MRFAWMIEPQQGLSYAEQLAIARHVEAGGFEALFRSDHYQSFPGPAGNPTTDAWAVLAGLARDTSRLHLGALVSPVTFRLPGNMAKVAMTVDEMSGGRVELGLGTGWNEAEHRQYGFPFPPIEDRAEMLEEQLEIVHGLLASERFSFDGRHYQLADCEFLFKPVQRPHPPIIVGGNGGPRIARLVARWADEFNTVGGSPQEVAERITRVRDAVDKAGRDQSTVVTSLMTWVYVGADEDEFRARVERARLRDPDPDPFDDALEELSKDCIVGTPERAAERISEYAAAGVQRIVLNHELFDDIGMLELLAREVLPRVED